MGIVKNIIYRTFNYAEENGYLEILSRCVLGIYILGGGVVACFPQITFD